MVSSSPVLAAGNGTLYVSPSTASYNVGQTFNMQIRENSGTTSVNHSETTISYASSLLEFRSVSSSGSPFNSVLRSTGGNGGISINSETNSKVIHGDQLIATVNFQAVTAGRVAVIVSTSSTVLATASNQNQVGKISSTTYTLLAPAIIPAPTSTATASSTPNAPTIVSSPPTDNSPTSAPTVTTPPVATVPATTSPVISSPPATTQTQAPKITYKNQPKQQTKTRELKPTTVNLTNPRTTASWYRIVEVASAVLFITALAVLVIFIMRHRQYTKALKTKSSSSITYNPEPPAISVPYHAGSASQSEVPSPYPSAKPYTYSLPPILADGTPVNPLSTSIGALVVAPPAKSELEETINRTFYPLRTNGIMDRKNTINHNEPLDMFETARRYPASFGNDLYIPPPVQSPPIANNQQEPNDNL